MESARTLGKGEEGRDQIMQCLTDQNKKLDFESKLNEYKKRPVGLPVDDISSLIISPALYAKGSQIAVGCKDNVKNILDQRLSHHQESPK